MHKILIVDDSATMRMLVKLALKPLVNTSVVEAKDGVDAIEKVNAEKPDLVITDLNMPEMNGFDFIKYLKQNDSKNIPIIVLTTEGRESDKEKAKELGADVFIQKPFQAPSIQKIVKEKLGI